MSEQSPRITQKNVDTATDATGPVVRRKLVAGSATNIHTQFSAGAAIDASSGFTAVPSNTATRIPQVVTGSSHVETTYTLTGTHIVTGEVLVESLTVAAGAQTEPFTLPFDRTITAFSSDVDPEDTVDLQWGDTRVIPAASAIFINTTAGDVAGRLVDDDVDITMTYAKEQWLPERYAIIRLTGTTAAGLVLGW